MDKLIFLLVAVLVFFSCKKPLQNSTSTKDDKDSSFVEKIRLVPVGIKSDAINFTAQVLCDPVTGKPKPFSVSKRGQRSTLSATVSPSGGLFVSSVCDSLNELVSVKDTEIRVLKTKLQNTVAVKPQRFTAWYDTLARWIALLLSLYIICRYTYKKYFL